MNIGDTFSEFNGRKACVSDKRVPHVLQIGKTASPCNLMQLQVRFFYHLPCKSHAVHGDGGCYAVSKGGMEFDVKIPS